MRLLNLLAALLASAPLSALVMSVPLRAFAFPHAVANTSYVYPVMGPRLSSSFGSRRHPIYRATRHHSGVDLAAPQGAPIRAISAGTVVFADPYSGYGKLIVIQHRGGWTSHYGHCRELRVKPGQKINAGQIIATVGSTGQTTGPHLHLEIRKNGRAINPEKLLPGLTEEAEG